MLRHLDLSWNGFSNEGAKALGDALKENSTLTVLDLSSNRINTIGADHLAKGLSQNESLKVLKVGQRVKQRRMCSQYHSA